MITQKIYRHILDELMKEYQSASLMDEVQCKRIAWSITQKLHESADKTPNPNFTSD